MLRITLHSSRTCTSVAEPLPLVKWLRHIHSPSSDTNPRISFLKDQDNITYIFVTYSGTYYCDRYCNVHYCEIYYYYYGALAHRPALVV